MRGRSVALIALLASVVGVAVAAVAALVLAALVVLLVLLRPGPSFPDECVDSDDPLVLAAVHSDVDGLRAQLRQGPGTVGDESPATALACAVREGRLAGTRVLLEEGVPPSEVAVAHAVGSWGSIPAGPDGDAERTLRRELLGLLLSHGADPNRPVSGEPTPLLRAAWKGDPGLVDLLLWHGAHVDAGGQIGSGHLDTATFVMDLIDGRRIVPEELRPQARGELVDIPPLHAAVWRDHREVAERLLEAGADPNRAADGTYTPLYLAALRGNAGMAQLLLDHAADPAPDVGGAVPSPADIARFMGYQRVADLIDQHAASPDP